MEKSLEQEILEAFPPYESIELLDKKTIMEKEVFEYVFALEDPVVREQEIVALMEKAKELKIASNFKKILRRYEKDNSEKNNSVIIGNTISISFQGLKDDEIFKIKNYYIGNEDGALYRMTMNGAVLVNYSPIVPLELYDDVHGRNQKIKIAFKNNNEWNELVTNYATITTSQSIVKLAELGMNVNSENARELIRFLDEFIHLNEIPRYIYSSKLGWTNTGELIPYSDKIKYFDEKKEISKLYQEKGTLEEWINYFKEARKYNSITRIIMATAVASVLVEKLNESGFVTHVYGKSEFGKTVACLVGQSMFGKAATGNDGIGYDFNFTAAAFEATLDIQNNIPIFLDEAGLQNEGKMDYYTAIMMIANGKGRQKSNKNSEFIASKGWHLTAVSNGEIDLIKNSSVAGAINRCISCEVKEPCFADLKETANFARNHYGTAIREIIKHLDKFDLQELHSKYRKELAHSKITAKQTNILSVIKVADKIIVDTLFKDGLYLTVKDLAKYATDKNEIAIEKRAYDAILDWRITNRANFLGAGPDDHYDDMDKKDKVFGKMLRENGEESVAFIPTELQRALENLGFNYKEVVKAWGRENYLITEADRNTKRIRFGNDNKQIRCVVLKIRNDEENDLTEKPEDMPF